MFIELIEHTLINLNTVKQVSPHGKRTALILEHGTIITDEPYSELSKRIMTTQKQQ